VKVVLEQRLQQPGAPVVPFRVRTLHARKHLMGPDSAGGDLIRRQRSRAFAEDVVEPPQKVIALGRSLNENAAAAQLHHRLARCRQQRFGVDEDVQVRAGVPPRDAYRLGDRREGRDVVVAIGTCRVVCTRAVEEYGMRAMCGPQLLEDLLENGRWIHRGDARCSARAQN